MRIIRFTDPDTGRPRAGVSEDGVVRTLEVEQVADLLALDLRDFRAAVERVGDPISGSPVVLAPIDGATEVWASGVTYERSRQGRTAESAQPDIYDLVYAAERPELFFKSVAWRVVGDAAEIGIRSDSELNVPEPELALVLNRHGELVGYTICDDVSSRTLEGENPLYLPQAKVYAGSCSVGPAIVPAWAIADPLALTVEVEVRRGPETAWAASTSTAQLVRGLDGLAAELFAGLDFPQGAVLSTGTGLVPELDFTLAHGDVVEIRIEGLGSLRNTVVVGKEHFASQWERHIGTAQEETTR